MPSPVAHSLAGAALYLAWSPARRPLAHWRTALLCVAGASAADLDFVAGLAVGDWNRFHQGASHSLAVALALGFVLAWLPLRSLGGWGRRWALFTALAVSHLALDLVTRDAKPPYGIPLLWPFSSLYVDTFFDLFPNMQRGSLTVIFSAWNGRALVTEGLLLGPVLVAVAWYRLGRRRRLTPARLHG